MNVNKVVSNPLNLYRYLLRQCKKLPTNAQDHYKHHLRQVSYLHLLNSLQQIDYPVPTFFLLALSYHRLRNSTKIK